MVYTTLKANKEHDISNMDLAYYCEENWKVVADLFENSEKYYDDWEETDFDKLYVDYTERQVASAVLKHLRARAKDKEEVLMIWNKTFIDLDCDGEIAYDQLKDLIEAGEITGSNQLKEIQRKASKKGVTISKGYYEGIYYHTVRVEDLIDEYFPCYADLTGDYCNNCGNCQ